MTDFDPTSTAVILPPPGAWELEASEPSTAVIRDEVVPLDPNETDAAWEARIIRICSPGRKVLALRD